MLRRQEVDSGRALRLTRRLTGTIIAGLVIGAVYTLSPLTVWFTLGMVVLVGWAGRGLPDEERQWVRALVVVAIALRVIAVLWLFVTTAHARVPFGHFFGDEEYFIRRAIWLRNVALGLPVHGADLVYAFDDYSATSYVYILAFLFVLVGPAPYGVHLFSAALYLTAIVMLFRIVRGSFGGVPAFA